MAIWIRIPVGLLLIAHGLVHLLYLSPEVKEFSLDRSWLLLGTTGRSVGTALIWGIVGVFSLLGLAVWGAPVLVDMWPTIAIVGALLSLVLLVIFWHPWLVFGVLINVGLIVVAMIQPDWV